MRRYFPALARGVAYCVAHRKQLAAAIAFGAGLLESVQKAH